MNLTVNHLINSHPIFLRQHTTPYRFNHLYLNEYIKWVAIDYHDMDTLTHALDNRYNELLESVNMYGVTIDNLTHYEQFYLSKKIIRYNVLRVSGYTHYEALKS